MENGKDNPNNNTNPSYEILLEEIQKRDTKISDLESQISDLKNLVKANFTVGGSKASNEQSSEERKKYLIKQLEGSFRK